MAVREWVQRIHLLSAIPVGAMVTEELDDDAHNRDASPYLVWKWLVAEAQVRQMRGDPVGKMPHPTAPELANRTIGSIDRAPAGEDGVSYLRDMIAAGIHTPLADEYSAEVLKLSGAQSLDTVFDSVNATR